jgi:hypothetical protein
MTTCAELDRAVKEEAVVCPNLPPGHWAGMAEGYYKESQSSLFMLLQEFGQGSFSRLWSRWESPQGNDHFRNSVAALTVCNSDTYVPIRRSALGFITTANKTS